MSFLPTFDAKWSAILHRRAVTFRAAFANLEQRPGPYVIVETGCMRSEPTDEAANNDGSSTLLFDDFVRHQGGEVYSCELKREHCETAAKHVSEAVSFIVGDAVRSLLAIPKSADLLYLDSFDLDWLNPHPSALHHLQEMASASRVLQAGSLVLIDDYGPCGGKGMYVVNWLHRIGAKPLARGYQYLWEIP